MALGVAIAHCPGKHQLLEIAEADGPFALLKDAAHKLATAI
jgi:hypothetical protein